LEFYIPIKYLGWVLNSGSILGPTGGAIVAQLIYNSEYLGSASQCEHCACPLSYEILRSENFIDNVVERTTKRTTKYSDGSSDTKIDKDYIYEGRRYADYKCFNCNREDHPKNKDTWINSPPETGLRVYNLPQFVIAATKKTFNVENVDLGEKSW